MELELGVSGWRKIGGAMVLELGAPAGVAWYKLDGQAMGVEMVVSKSAGQHDWAMA